MIMKRLIAILLLLLLAGCQTIPGLKSDDERLRERLRSFEGTVRWGQLHNMYAFMKPVEGEPVEIPEGLENIRVVSYEQAAPQRKLADDLVIQSVTITYLYQDEQVLRTVRDDQRWQRDAESRAWFRVNPPPRFK